ncbi:biotin/lipoyl-binding protein, partial [Agromyces sp. CFH 90414]
AGSAAAIAADGTVWAHAGGRTAAFRPIDRASRLAERLARLERGGTADPELRAPMPGTVTAVFVEDGASVAAGTAILAIEAMKMEHRVVAPVDGVARLAVSRGEQVSRDQAVARIHPAPTDVPPEDPAPEDPHEGPIDHPHEASARKARTTP